jgi:hypothetical protein
MNMKISHELIVTRSELVKMLKVAHPDDTAIQMIPNDTNNVALRCDGPGSLSLTFTRILSSAA